MALRSAAFTLAVCAVLAACGGPVASHGDPSEAASTQPSTGEASEGALPVTGTTEASDDAPVGAIDVEVFGDRLVFEPDELTATAGTVSFFIHYAGTGSVHDAPHNLQIGTELPPAAPLVGSDHIRPDESAVFTVVGLEPGSYRFWCSYLSDIGSHYAAGMVGTLTVTP